MKLLVRNLARTTTEHDVRLLFKEHGRVTECTLVLDQETGLSKGFAFVEMPDPDEAFATMNALNLYEFAGNKIRVKRASH
jgi:RNA recognition motif-containing protein